MNQDISTLHQGDNPIGTYKNMIVQCAKTVNESTGITRYDYIGLIDGQKVIEIGTIHEFTPEELYGEYERGEKEKLDRLDRIKKQNELALREKAKLMRVVGYDFYGTKNYDTIDIATERKKYSDIDTFLDSMVLAVMEWEGLTYEEALEKHFILDEEAKKHVKKGEVEGITMNQEALAEKVGDLYYDALAAVLSKLSETLALESKRHTELDDPLKLDALVLKASQNLEEASAHIMTAWEICKPFLKAPLNPKHTSDTQGIPNATLGERIGKLNYGKLSTFLKLLGEKIHRDGLADEGRGRQKLATELFESSKLIQGAGEVLNS